MDIQFVTSVKDEGPYLLEWIAHHRAIGVTGFTFFHNDCSDGTVRILNRLKTLGLVRVIHNATPPARNPQGKALRRMMELEHVVGADWVGFIDIDEFINVHVGDGTLPGLIEYCGSKVDAISLNWMMFGSGKQRSFRDEAVTSRFTMANEPNYLPSARLRETKSLFRPSRFAQCNQHRPFTEPAGEPRNWLLGSGKQAPARFQSRGLNLPYRHVGYQLGQVNHYAVKSREEFLLKRMRGSGFRTALDREPDKIRFNWWYWDLYDRNQRNDTSLSTTQILRRRELQESDGKLKELHEASVRTHKSRIADRYNQDDFTAFLESGKLPIATWRLKRRHAAMGLKQAFPVLNRLADLTS